MDIGFNQALGIREERINSFDGQFVVQVQKGSSTWRRIRRHAGLSGVGRTQEETSAELQLRRRPRPQHASSLCSQTWHEAFDQSISQRPRRRSKQAKCSRSNGAALRLHWRSKIALAVGTKGVHGHSASQLEGTSGYGRGGGGRKAEGRGQCAG